MKEVNDLLKRLGELEDAPLIWINKKVYDMAEEIERLNNIINEIIKCIDSLYVPYEMEENWEFYGKEYDDREKVIEEIKKLKGSDKDEKRYIKY